MFSKEKRLLNKIKVAAVRLYQDESFLEQTGLNAYTVGLLIELEENDDLHRFFLTSYLRKASLYHYFPLLDVKEEEAFWPDYITNPLTLTYNDFIEEYIKENNISGVLLPVFHKKLVKIINNLE